MNANKQYNIMWLLVDSVRNYKGAGDDRDRIEFMDEFGAKSVEFTRAFTSAPSTVMSISSMMCGVPAYLLARNYEDFRFDSHNFKTLHSILSQNGYDTYGLFRHPSTREKFLNAIYQPRKKEWPAHLSHADWWSNEDISLLSQKILRDRDRSRPAFVFHHYNCRHDPNISQIVKDQYQWLCSNGYNADNTIFILCSDHGYPDPTRGYTPQLFKARNMTHDMLMQNDNIMIPLLFAYPNCPKGKKITTPVISLDLFPTLLDLNGLDQEIKDSPQVVGESLIPLINDQNREHYEARYFRSDSRLLLQDNRVTTLSNGRFKYLMNWDAPQGKREQFYDHLNDPLELKDLLESSDREVQNALTTFRNEFEKIEKAALDFQIQYLSEKFSSKLSSETSLSKVQSVGIIGNGPPRYFPMLLKIVTRAFPHSRIRLYWPDSNILSEIQNDLPGTVEIVHLPASDSWAPTLQKAGSVELLLFALDNKYANGGKDFFKRVQMVPASKMLAVDYNMSLYQKRSYWYYKFLAIREKWHFIKDEPKILGATIWSILKSAYYVFKRRLGFGKIKAIGNG